MVTAGHAVILFYKYVEVEAPLELKQEQEQLCERLGLVGRILISAEGINATLSSPSRAKIDEYIAFLCAHKVFAMRPDDFKHSSHAHEEPPFVGIIIKHVKEIVSTGGIVARPDMTASDKDRGYLTPQQFHEAMRQAVKDKEGTVVLDVRAHKEFLVGHFENAVDPKVKNFSEYYAFLQNRVDEMKDKKVLMYCTGGIRCEKASNFLRSQGVNDVHHLKGGIHKYLEAYQDGGFFRGKNFVFDKRCYYARHGEVHCTDHQYLKHCYVTFLQFLEDKSSSKNKRRSIRNQLNKIAARLEAIDANPEAAAATLTLDQRPIHCRTCGLATFHFVSAESKMPATKSAPRRKRGAAVSSGPKKNRQWQLRRSTCGSWLRRGDGLRLKNYAEKNRTSKTPQEIAREILMKNGLLSPASQAAANTTATSTGNQEEESRTRGNMPRANASIPSNSTKPLTKEQQKLIERRRQEALERRRPPSPLGALTEEQQERIEKRRREALEKRRRAKNSGMIHVQPPAVIQPDSADNSRYGLQPSVVPPHYLNQQPPQVSRIEARPTASTSHRVVTPDNLPATNQVVKTQQTRPDFFWDDLEAAAEIAQWENEHMAEVTLVQPSLAKTPRGFSRKDDALQHSQRMRQGKPKTRTPPDSAISTISQELAAAAEIIQWEKEHEVFPDVPAIRRPGGSSDSDPELDAPQFQLLPVQVTDNFEHQQNAIEAVHPQGNSAKSGRNLPRNNPQLKSRSNRKRPLVAAPPPGQLYCFSR
ncbi:Rhodanese-like domain [Phytophthora cactorum]|nr:Rhodanese-like domain [Phytophthora cactorum]